LFKGGAVNPIFLENQTILIELFMLSRTKNAFYSFCCDALCFGHSALHIIILLLDKQRTDRAMKRPSFYYTSTPFVQGNPEPANDSSLKYHVDIAVYVMTVPIPPILATVGLIGNFLSFRLMNQKKYEDSTTCFYMRCMSVFDCFFIYGRMFLRYLLVIAPQLFKNEDVKPIFCRYYMVSFVIGLCLSPWILIAMSIDRFIALNWPLKAAVLCTMRRAKINAVVIFLCGVSFGLLKININYQEKVSFWLCPYEFDEPWDEIYSATEGTITSILPIIIFLISNIGILRALYRSKQNPALNKSTSSSKESSITLATILVTCALIVFQVPDKISDLFWANWRSEVTSEVKQWQRLTLNFTVLAESMNFCLNSYIYILPCKRLRREMFKIIRQCRSE
jgi:hypothetical protein